MEFAGTRNRMWWWAAAALLLLVAAAAGWLLLARPEQQPAIPAESERQPPGNVLPQASAPPAEAVLPAMRDRPAADQLALAFRAAFGRAGAATRSVEGSELVYRPGELRWIGDRAVLVSPGTNREDCHACAGALAVHYLEPAGEGYAVRGEWLAGGGRDDWGEAPQWSFVTVLSDQPMLRTESSGGNQGLSCSFATLHRLGDAGPRAVARVQTGYRNASGFGANDGVALTGRIVNARPGRGFDVAWSGSREFVQRWTMQAGRYVPVEDSPQPPLC